MKQIWRYSMKSMYFVDENFHMYQEGYVNEVCLKLEKNMF